MLCNFVTVFLDFNVHRLEHQMFTYFFLALKKCDIQIQALIKIIRHLLGRFFTLDTDIQR
jgi:hypothetical protein